MIFILRLSASIFEEKEAGNQLRGVFGGQEQDRFLRRTDAEILAQTKLGSVHESGSFSSFSAENIY